MLTAGAPYADLAWGTTREWYDCRCQWRIAVRRFFPVIAALCSFPFAGIARAQDVVKFAPEHNKIILENADVRVIENTLAPGEKDAMHTHPSGWYYVTKPGMMKIVFADGKVATWEAKEGEGGWLQTKAPHTAENVGKTTLVYVLVEVKSAEAPHSPPAERSRGSNP
jgi:mannose-6-phosphate isomerase-like protein (cupin superfamily)